MIPFLKWVFPCITCLHLNTHIWYTDSVIKILISLMATFGGGGFMCVVLLLGVHFIVVLLHPSIMPKLMSGSW